MLARRGTYPYSPGMTLSRRPGLRLLTGVLLALLFLGLGGTAAYAATEPDPPDRCFSDLGPHGELPSCTWDGNEWTVSYEEGPIGLGSPGIPSGFVALFVVVAIAGAAMTIYRVTMARRMAEEAGLDPDRAATMTLLSDDGLDATYLASSLRATKPSEPAAGPSRLTHDRLRELQQLRDDGLVTAEEYEARRKAILDSI